MSAVDLIHPTAIVSPDAKLGWGVKVGPYAVIEAGSRIGDGTKIEAFVRIKPCVAIGRNCHIFENAVLGSDPQDRDFGGEVSYVRIGDDVVLRENVTVNRATGEGLETYVGSGSLIMEGCHLGHNVRVGEHCTVSNKVGFSGHVEVGDYAVVSGLTGFHQFVKVGPYAMVGGLAKVVKDVPPYSLVDGHPARVYGLNVVGLRRRGFSQEDRTKIKNIYRLLYDRRMRRTEAIAAVETEYGDDEYGVVILTFLKSLKRGLTAWARKDGHRAGEPE